MEDFWQENDIILKLHLVKQDIKSEFNEIIVKVKFDNCRDYHKNLLKIKKTENLDAVKSLREAEKNRNDPKSVKS